MPDEIGFAVLRYREKTPVLAACTFCQLKFLTPAGMMNDPVAADEYLWRKYISHRCATATEQRKDTHRGNLSTLDAIRSPRARAG